MEAHLSTMGIYLYSKHNIGLFAKYNVLNYSRSGLCLLVCSTSQVRCDLTSQTKLVSGTVQYAADLMVYTKPNA